MIRPCILICVLLVATSCFQDVAREFFSYKNDVSYMKKYGEVYPLEDFAYLFFTTDSSKSTHWFKRLNYIDERKFEEKELKKIDLSDGFYSDTLLFYKDKLSTNRVAIWKQEGEYWSYLNCFLFIDKSIISIGDLAIGKWCVGCDAFNLPENEIVVFGTGKTLEITFKGKSIYRGSESQGTPYNSVNIISSKLKLIYNGNKSKIIY